MVFAYRSGFNQSFFSNASGMQSYGSTPTQANTSCFNLPAGNATYMPQSNSPEAMMCGMKNMLQGVFAQFQQTAAVFQNFIQSSQGQACPQTSGQQIPPEAKAIMEELKNVEPDSPHAQQLQAKLGSLLPPDQAKAYFWTAKQKQLFQTTQNLYTVKSNLEPDSPEAQQLDQRIAAIQKILNQDGPDGTDNTMMM